MAAQRDPNWIEGAIKRPGALHEKLDVPEGKDIPKKKLAAAEKSKSPIERRQAHLAAELEQFQHKK
jgi:hypothetical protein